MNTAHGQPPERTIRARLTRWARRGLVTLTGGAVIAGSLTLAPLPVRACPYTPCPTDSALHGAHDQSGTTRGLVAEQHMETRLHITEEFNDWEKFLIDVFFMEHFLPAMMLMTQQLTAVAMQQMQILAKFFDAKQQLETQLLFQRMKAEAHKDYHPSMGMCVFGTNVRSLSAAERRAEITQAIMAQRAQDRELGHVDSIGAEGPQQDKKDRLEQFKTTYCNVNDNNEGLKKLCSGTAAGAGPNSDVDYTRIIDRRLTLEIDLMDGEDPTPDERDIFALAENLFSHDVFVRMPESVFEAKDARKDKQSNQTRWLDVRALVAKRSVAQNSFNAIVGMRAMGTPAGGTPGVTNDLGPQGDAADTGKYMQVVMKQLGLTDEEEIKKYLGERPSYYAQMEILTKKLYQRPEFYTDLYDTPANVDRKMVSMQAIGLMQDFDTLKSYLRQEMILAVLVEMELSKSHRRVQDSLNSLVREGPRIKKEK